MAMPKKAMLFAAGLGTRLRPLTDSLPKPLIPVGGKPLIAHSLEALKRGGVEEVMVNTHHLAEQIKQFVGDGSRFGLRVHYSHEPILLGTGGGLLKARTFFEHERSFWVMNSDTLLEIDLKKIDRATTLVIHRGALEFGGVWIDASPTLPLPPTRGKLATDEGARQTRVSLRGGKGEGASRQVLSFFAPPPSRANAEEVDFCGISLLNPSIFAPLAEASTRNPAPCLIREGLAPLLHGGQAIHAYAYSGYFNDVGTVKRLEEAQRYLSEYGILTRKESH